MTTTKNEEYIKFEYVMIKNEFAYFQNGEHTLIVNVHNVSKVYEVNLLG